MNTADKIIKYIENLYEEYFTDDFKYIEIDEELEDGTLKFIYEVKGGYEADVNAYWGGDEYVDDFMNSIECTLIKEAENELDESDLTGVILIKY